MREKEDTSLAAASFEWLRWSVGGQCHSQNFFILWGSWCSWGLWIQRIIFYWFETKKHRFIVWFIHAFFSWFFQGCGFMLVILCREKYFQRISEPPFFLLSNWVITIERPFFIFYFLAKLWSPWKMEGVVMGYYHGSRIAGKGNCIYLKTSKSLRLYINSVFGFCWFTGRWRGWIQWSWKSFQLWKCDYVLLCQWMPFFFYMETHSNED